LVGRLTRGHYPLHYRDAETIAAGFARCGFAHTEVLDPGQQAAALGLPVLRQASLVRVIEARV
ncbi:MAG: class I SAM-dependent methyltransferase, partial [Pseudomonas sp.]